jgi:TolB protein
MPRELTKHSAIETEPVLSPDGKKLAYVSDRTGQPQVYLMDLSSKKVTRISRKGGYNTSPAWSPDSSMVAFTSQKRGSKSTIYRVRIDDNLGTQTRVSPENISSESPAWSPDGSMVAFQGFQGVWKIFYVLSSGGPAERLTNSSKWIVETGPTWSSRLR